MSVYTNKYQFVSSLRADLCGGTLDIWPLYLILDHCKTIQLSLKMQTQTKLTVYSDHSNIRIKISDKLFSFESKKEFLKVKDKNLSLIQAVVCFLNPAFGFNLEIFSSSPIGGGLGGSSSLLAGLVQCFSSALKQPMEFIDSLFLCRDLEAQVLQTSTGIQDYIVSLLKIPPHQLNIVHLTALKPQVETKKASSEFLKHLILINTQIEHHSGETNGFIVQQALKGENLSELRECRDISLQMENCLLQNQFEDIPRLFQREFEIRKKMVKDFPQKVNDLIEFLYSNKVLAVKQMGAGSGGSLLLWTKNKEEVKKVCQKEGIPILEGF